MSRDVLDAIRESVAALDRYLLTLPGDQRESALATRAEMVRALTRDIYVSPDDPIFTPPRLPS